MAVGPKWADHGLVFPNTVGKIRRRDDVVRSLKRLLEEAGLPRKVRFHDLRHTAATLAIRQGVPIHAVPKMLGHSDPAMTLRRYAHVLDEGARRRGPGHGRPLLTPLTPRFTPTVPSRAVATRHGRFLEACRIRVEGGLVAAFTGAWLHLLYH